METPYDGNLRGEKLPGTRTRAFHAIYTLPDGRRLATLEQSRFVHEADAREDLGRAWLEFLENDLEKAPYRDGAYPFRTICAGVVRSMGVHVALAPVQRAKQDIVRLPALPAMKLCSKDWSVTGTY